MEEMVETVDTFARGAKKRYSQAINGREVGGQAQVQEFTKAGHGPLRHM